MELLNSFTLLDQWIHHHGSLVRITHLHESLPSTSLSAVEADVILLTSCHGRLTLQRKLGFSCGRHCIMDLIPRDIFSKSAESVNHLFVTCPSSRLLNSLNAALGIKGCPAALLHSFWTTWRRKRVRRSMRKAWDRLQILIERIDRLFRNHRASSNSASAGYNQFPSILEATLCSNRLADSYKLVV